MFAGVVVGFQVRFFTRDDVASLAGLGVEQIGQNGVELFENQVSVIHPDPVLTVLSHGPERHDAHENQND
jgi:hypothetical protein